MILEKTKSFLVLLIHKMIVMENYLMNYDVYHEKHLPHFEVTEWRLF